MSAKKEMSRGGAGAHSLGSEGNEHCPDPSLDLQDGRSQPCTVWEWSIPDRGNLALG